MATSTIDLTFAANVEKAEEGKLPKNFSGVAYSGGVVPGFGFYGNIAIDLSTLKKPTKSVFALVNHDFDQRAGRLSLDVSETEVTMGGKFFSNSSGKMVAGEFAEEAPWELSVGINGKVEVFSKPKTMTLNGREMTLDAVIRNGHIREVSFVPAGADPNTSSTAFSANGEIEMSEVKEVIDELKLEVSTLTSEKEAANVKIAGLEAELSAVRSELATSEAALAASVEASEMYKNNLASMEVELNGVKAVLDELKAGIRLEAIKSLFADTGKELNDESQAKYAAMSDEVFALMSEELRSVKRANIEGLMGEVATNGASGSATDLDTAVAAYMAANVGVSREKATVACLRANPSLYVS